MRIDDPDIYDQKTSEYLGEMHTVWAPQYSTACVVALWNEPADKIIQHARHVGAVYHEDGPDDECFVVVLRPEIGPELYTESALRRSRTLSAAERGGQS